MNAASGTHLIYSTIESRTRCRLPDLHELTRSSGRIISSSHGTDNEKAVDARLAQGGQIACLDAAADHDGHGADAVEFRQLRETSRDDMALSIATAVLLRRRLMERSRAEVVDSACVSMAHVVEQFIRARRQADDGIIPEVLAADSCRDIALTDVDAVNLDARLARRQCDIEPVVDEQDDFI